MLRFNAGYNQNPEHKIKIRYMNVLQAKMGNKILGKNEEHPIYNLDYEITPDQCNLLLSHYIRFETLD